MFAQKVRGMSQRRVVPAFKTKHFGQRSKSIMKPDAYTQRYDHGFGLDNRSRRESRDPSDSSRGPQTDRPGYRNPQSYRGGMQPRTPNARNMAGGPNRFGEPEVIRGPEIHMKITNDDIDMNKSRMKAQQTNKSNFTNL